MASAQDLWCQGWSEPGSGSDLASLVSRGEKVDGGWRLSGQKTWTTRGAFCTHLFGLFRTDPEAQRHKGLTYFLVPLDAPGVTVRGFARLDGDEGFAEVFLDDVFVPDSAVLGGVGQGWSVAMATTGSERGLTLRSPGRYTATVTRLIELARDRGARGEAVQQRLAQAWMDAEAYRLFTLKQVSDEQQGRSRVGESSLTKLFWSELDIRLHELADDILGEDAELEGPWSKGFQFSLSGPIYAGTNEVQKNIVAERLLGLPRA
jgi:alkylation response protein AidB-like acyl-CoA dehydrogenase